MTTLRNVIGGLTLEQTLTSREGVNTELRAVLDEATGKWGIRINRVEIKSVDPPPDIKAAMEKQMRAERDRRAAILTAEGTKQAAILTAEGEKQAAVLTAEGAAPGGDPARRGRGEGDRDGLRGDPRGRRRSASCSAYQYLQMLPKLAEGEANKVFVIPSRVHPGLRRDRRHAGEGRRRDAARAQRRRRRRRARAAGGRRDQVSARAGGR